MICFGISIFARLIAQQPYSLHYTTDDGLPSNTIYSIKEDKYGFLWISSPIGVARFDGTHFISFTLEDGLPDNEILGIEKDRQGRLWFIGFNGRLGYYDYQKFYIVENIKFKSYAASFYQDSQDSIHFSNQTERVVLKIDHQNHCKSRHYEGLKNITFQNQGQRIDTSFHYIRGAYHLHIGHDSLLFFQEKNKKWTVILQTPKDSIHLITLPTDFKSFDLLCNIFIDKNEIYLTSNSKGLFHFVKKGQNYQFKETIFANKSVPAFHQDKSQNRWLGTLNEGIYMLINPNIGSAIFSNKGENEPNNVTSIAKSKQNGLYLAYKNGTIQRLKPDAKPLFLNNEAPESNIPIKKIFTLSTHTLLVVSAYPQNYVLRNNKIIPILKNINFGVQKDAFLINDTLWIACISGLRAFRIENPSSNKTSQTLIYESPFNDRINAVTVSKNGTVWFASNSKGLGFIRKGTAHFLSKDANMLINKLSHTMQAKDKTIAEEYRFIDIHALNDSTILCLSDSRGLAIYEVNKQSFSLINQNILQDKTTNSGLSSNACNTMWVENNVIWIGTNKGVSVFEYVNEKCVHRFNISKRDGLLANEVNSIYIDEDTVYIGTTAGLNIYNKTKLPIAQENAKLIIAELSIDYADTTQSTLFPSQSIYVQKGYQNIGLKCAFLAFGNKETIQLRYRIDQNEWIYVQLTEINLTLLAPGTHTITIQARKGQTDWSQPVALEVVMPTYFYQTAGFYLALLLIMLVLLYQLLRYYIQKEKHKFQLEQKSKEHLLSLEMKAAQAMMNPHFLYNILNSIQFFMNTSDLLNANRFLTQFAKLMRLNLSNLREKQIPLSNEIALIEAYLSLEKLRFPSKIQYAIQTDLKNSPEKLLIPNMIIQPLIENAIWHGVLMTQEGGEIIVEIKEYPNSLKIIIIDSGLGIDKSLAQKNTTTSTHKSIGLSMIKERLKLLSLSTGLIYDLTIKDRSTLGENLRGTKAELHIPTLFI